MYLFLSVLGLCCCESISLAVASWGYSLVGRTGFSFRWLLLLRSMALGSRASVVAFPRLLTSLVAQTVKRLSTMRETWVRSLAREDPLEKEMAPHSSTIAWKIPWTQEPGRLHSMGSQRVRHDWTTSLHFTSLQSTGSIAGTQRLSCSMTCRIFPYQGWTLCLLHWQVDSLPQNYQWNPRSLWSWEGGKVLNR